MMMISTQICKLSSLRLKKLKIIVPFGFLSMEVQTFIWEVHSVFSLYGDKNIVKLVIFKTKSILNGLKH